MAPLNNGNNIPTIKPKLWNIAALSGVTAAIAAALLLTGAEKHAAAVSLVLDLYFPLVLVLMIAAFRGQLQYNP